MATKMLSIIVPVYNVSRYLSECIESILNQEFQDFELILVDDGSVDDSGKICDEYAEKDNRILVIHQKNGGVSSARKAGVVATKSEWICFVDGDDTIPVDSIQTLMSRTSVSTDIVVGRCDDRKIPTGMTLEEYRRKCISGQTLHSGPIARVYRSCLFNENVFDIPKEIIRGEDLIMNVRLAFRTEKPPILIDKKVYNYRRNENSVMHTSLHTIEHAMLFHKYLSLSIPNKEKYNNEVIKNKIKSIINVLYDNPSDHSWRKTIFWIELKEQIKRTKYKITWRERIILASFNRFTLKAAIKFASL